MSGKVCKCGKGHKSAYDGKCGHCRTKRERKAHQALLNKPVPAVSPPPGAPEGWAPIDAFE